MKSLGDECVSGMCAKAYVGVDHELIKAAIGFWFIDYRLSQYLQVRSGFAENLSTIGTVFNIGCKSIAMKLKETKGQRSSN